MIKCFYKNDKKEREKRERKEREERKQAFTYPRAMMIKIFCKYYNYHCNQY